MSSVAAALWPWFQIVGALGALFAAAERERFTAHRGQGRTVTVRINMTSGDGRPYRSRSAA